MTVFFAGIDGGQSSTTAVVLDDRGVVRGRGVAGPSDHVDEPAGSRRCADACETALLRAVEHAGLPPGTEFGAVVVGLSGFDGELHGVAPQFASRNVRFVHDAPIALAGAVPQRPGVVVIAGTGSVAYGEGEAGTSARVGGWGYLFGDEGSSFSLARTALARAMSAEDRGIPSRLGEAAIAFFNYPDLRALVRAFSLRTLSRPAIATFARVVLDAARLGDAEANALVDDAAQALASLAAIALERLELSRVAVPVAFVGGMVQAPEMRRRCLAHLSALAPNALAVEPLHDPAVGAALLAVADAGMVAPLAVREPETA